MNFESVPELAALVWMAVVLVQVSRRREGRTIALWMTGLLLIVIEQVARMLYVAPGSPLLHRFTHALALDSYFLAGTAFFQSAVGRLRMQSRAGVCLACSVAPHLLILTAYGWECRAPQIFLVATALGFASCATLIFIWDGRRAQIWIQLSVWTVSSVIALSGNYRLEAYFSLFVVYSATALAFSVTLPKERWGRSVVVAGFSFWALCFVTHPWVAHSHKTWEPLIGKIWDIQKFFITFGLLLVSLHEESSSREVEALHDVLTGLPNRRLFEDRLKQAVASAHRRKARVVLLNMDLNGFKAVNDRFGHEAGDDLLREVSRRLSLLVRQSDTFARTGGDEFHAVLADFNLTDEEARARSGVGESAMRIIKKVKGAVKDEEVVLIVDEVRELVQASISVGLAVYPEDAMSAEGLCRTADARMYRDKHGSPAGEGQQIRPPSSLLADTSFEDLWS